MVIPTTIRPRTNYVFDVLDRLVECKTSKTTLQVILSVGASNILQLECQAESGAFTQRLEENSGSRGNNLEIHVKIVEYAEYSKKLDGRINQTVQHNGDYYHDDELRSYWRSKQNLDFAIAIREAKRQADSHTDYILLLEDDMMATHCWDDQTRKAIDKIEKNIDQPSPSSIFCIKLADLGFCAALINVHHAEKFANFLWRNFDRKPCDWLLEDYANENNLNIIGLTPSLFQHVGVDSSLSGKTQIARSANFKT